MTRSADRPSPDRLLREAAARLDRRRFLTVTSAAAALAFTVNLPSAHAADPEFAPRVITDNPFTLGVASGDPLPDAVVLWTRLAPRPLEPGAGMPPTGSVRVGWEIARDERFRRVERRGSARAHAEFNYAVHVDVEGLDAGREYFYRFTVGTWTSPVGRTRTAPPRGRKLDSTRFAVVSCQAYEDGYFTAYRHLADENLDAVFHVGDYIYEYGIDAAGGDRKYTDRTLPAHFDHETVTLEDYRLRYSLYKNDPDLQAAHAAHPWYVTWDDHEVENNYAAGIPEKNQDPAPFVARRAAAYRAYWENQPLRMPNPRGTELTLYRRVHYGKLAQFDILDTRQYRDDQANGDGWQYPTPESENPARTLMGATQERWFAEGLRRSQATWNVIPQQVVFSRRKNTTAARSKLSMDAWDGYPAARERFLSAVEKAGTRNLVLLTGDVHVAYALDVKRNFDDPASRTVGVEFVGTSISSDGDGEEKPSNWNNLMSANPHMKFYDGRRGYTTLTLDHQHVRADYRVLPYITRPGAPVSTAASFVTEAGNPGIKPA
ncbi:alkaline phosphatase [Streptomyces sp. FH025]|uniref:alkaline phosphatase D family protein n=1 Tax=Streptomyces sp. FH025 TaxID=2815937 RepID=UPI001A9DBDD5|nr:alkaline phosphatase D family protein [Streptomyces sp. FH025]MBO1417609.1 alkaline phosphatase D family protein [Streptomyces sp. FH025]